MGDAAAERSARRARPNVKSSGKRTTRCSGRDRSAPRPGSRAQKAVTAAQPCAARRYPAGGRTTLPLPAAARPGRRRWCAGAGAPSSAAKVAERHGRAPGPERLNGAKPRGVGDGQRPAEAVERARAIHELRTSGGARQLHACLDRLRTARGEQRDQTAEGAQPLASRRRRATVPREEADRLRVEQGLHARDQPRWLWPADGAEPGQRVEVLPPAVPEPDVTRPLKTRRIRGRSFTNAGFTCRVLVHRGSRPAMRGRHRLMTAGEADARTAQHTARNTAAATDRRKAM